MTDENKGASSTVSKVRLTVLENDEEVKRYFDVQTFVADFGALGYQYTGDRHVIAIPPDPMEGWAMFQGLYGPWEPFDASEVAAYMSIDAMERSFRKDREERDAKEQARKDDAVKLQAEHPELVAHDVNSWPNGGAVIAAKNLRIELKARFPGVKFSVKKHDWSSLGISWDGELQPEQMRDIVLRYKSGQSWSDAFGGADYISNEGVHCWQEEVDAAEEAPVTEVIRPVMRAMHIAKPDRDAPVDSEEYALALCEDIRSAYSLAKLDAFMIHVEQMDKTGAWRNLVNAYGNPFASLTQFLTTPPMAGIGMNLSRVRNIVAAIDAPDELMKRTEALHQPGRPAKSNKGASSTVKRGSTNPAYLAARLKRDFPDLAARVERGELTIRDAAKLAGLIRHTVNIEPTLEGIERCIAKHLDERSACELAERILGKAQRAA